MKLARFLLAGHVRQQTFNKACLSIVSINQYCQLALAVFKFVFAVDT